MAQCKWCDKRGWFLSVDPNGLCSDCEPLVGEILGKVKSLERLAHQVDTGKTFRTRLSRCELGMEHAEYLIQFERKGIPTITPAPSTVLNSFREIGAELIVAEAEKVTDTALEKSRLASTPSARERALAAGLLKLRETTEGLDERSAVKPLEDALRREKHRVVLDGHLEAARKAEFKGNTKKAIDQYQEALFFLRNDDINDAEQASSIQMIESRLAELAAG